MREAAKITEANGCSTTTKKIYAQSKRRREWLRTIAKEQSMLTDLPMGQHLEVKVILGNTVKRLRGLRISTPVFYTMYALTKALSSTQFK
jgi:ketopantoate reductase